MKVALISYNKRLSQPKASNYLNVVVGGEPLKSTLSRLKNSLIVICGFKTFAGHTRKDIFFHRPGGTSSLYAHLEDYKTTRGGNSSYRDMSKLLTAKVIPALPVVQDMPNKKNVVAFLVSDNMESLILCIGMIKVMHFLRRQVKGVYLNLDYDVGTITTGILEFRTTFSATLPSKTLDKPVFPLLPQLSHPFDFRLHFSE